MNQRAAVLSLISPAYLWLTLTILLPLSAMLYYSFLSDVPIGNREVSWTLENYGTFF
jgi:spermidine/putrescine transport system permease protein